MENQYAKNIPKIFWLGASYSFMIIMPVIVPFFQSRGLDMAQVYQLQAIFAFFVLVFEVPSGYFSDLFGRKLTLMTASAFHSLGFLGLALAPDFWVMALGEVLLAVSISLYSGTDLSLLYDSLAASGKKSAPIKKIGQKIFYKQMGESVAGLFGGWLILFHFEAPALAQALVGLFPLAIASTLVEPPRQKMQKRTHKENWSHIYQSLFKNSTLLNLILLTGIFYSFVTLVAVWSFQKYWDDIGIPLSVFGYLWFAINAAVGVTARYAHKIEKKWGSEFVLIVMGVAPLIGFFGMAFTEVFWGALFCLCFQLVRGLNSVVIADALNKRVGSEMRATANSIMGLGTRVFMISVGPLVGWIIDERGNFFAQELLGYLYILVFILVLLPLLAMRKQYAPIKGRPF